MPAPPHWRFQPFGPGNRARNSQVEKFFRSDTVADRPRAVIREGIQNSMDAATEESVNVRIALGTVPATSLTEFTGGLHPHVPAMRNKFPCRPTSRYHRRICTEGQNR